AQRALLDACARPRAPRPPRKRRADRSAPRSLLPAQEQPRAARRLLHRPASVAARDPAVSETKRAAPAIAVVVPNWNDARYVERCLRSLFEQAVPPDEL